MAHPFWHTGVAFGNAGKIIWLKKQNLLFKGILKASLTTQLQASYLGPSYHPVFFFLCTISRSICLRLPVSPFGDMEEEASRRPQNSQ